MVQTLSCCCVVTLARVVPFESVMAHEALLARTDFFADAPPALLRDLAASGAELPLIRGDVLFREGDVADMLYLVVSGRKVQVVFADKHGAEVILDILNPGDYFGEMALIDELPRSATIVARESSVVLAIPYEPVQVAFRSDPNLLWSVTRMLAKRLRAVDEALADSVFLDVMGRTAKRLLDLSEGNDQFTLPVTQEELAGWVGASRERVNKAIAAFIRLGWLEQRDRHYTILKRQSLEDRAS